MINLKTRLDSVSVDYFKRDIENTREQNIAKEEKISKNDEYWFIDRPDILKWFLKESVA